MNSSYWIAVVLLVPLALHCGGIDTREDLLADFRVWCTQVGIESHHLDIRNTVIDGIEQRGVFAADDISSGDQLLSIPFTAMMSRRTAEDGELGPWLLASGVARDITPTNEMALHLLHESVREDSPWASYIRLLPRDIPTTMFYTAEELDQLQSSTLRGFTLARKENAMNHYGTIVAPLTSEGATVVVDDEFSDDEDQDEALLRDASVTEWLWALSVLWSRAFSVKIGGEDMGALVPFADLFNAQPPGQLAQKPHVRAEIDVGKLVYYAVRDIPKDEEVLMPYGKLKLHSNAELLMNYGFVVEGNPYDSAMISCDWLKKMSLSKRALVSEMGTSPTQEYISVTRAFPLELLWVSRVVFLTEQEETELSDNKRWLVGQARADIVKAREAYEASDRAAWPQYVPLSAQLDVRATEFALRKLTRALESYSTTSKDDEHLWIHGHLAHRVKNALAVRLGEKKVIEQAIVHLERWRESLASSEGIHTPTHIQM